MIVLLIWLLIVVRLRCFCDLNDEWLPPFDDISEVTALCTKENRNIVMLRRGLPMMYSLFRHDALCWLEIQRYVPPRYNPLVWFLQSLGYCDINRAINWRRRGVEYKRDFQLMMTRAAFALICRQTDDIGRYQLSRYAALFRIMFEKINGDRMQICDAVISLYRNLYTRCHVAEPLGRIRLIEKICSGRSTVRLIKMRAFFRRFSRGCYTFDDFYDNDPRASISLGEALSNDTLFMNMLSTNLIGAISSDSQLPQIVLKTRLLLQHFSLAAIKLQRTIDNALRCATHTDSTQMLLYEGDDDTTNATDLNYEGEDFDEGCNSTILAYANIPNIKRFRMIARLAEIGIAIEAFLLVLVIANTIMLSTLLLQTKDHLSTATILFIFNILCSNVLFTASFLCLFSDLLDEKPFGQLSDESLEGWISPSLAIAETLNTHLFAGSDFNRHVIQETLYSLAQNGSLLGLTNLLILVLVVIHRSMEGKAIHLSKICVVTVFSLVWLFLFVTHIVFSALQFTAIHSIDEMFTRLALSRDSFDCASKAVSEYVEIGEHCDRVAPFHNFGVYLLRGHTFFTVTFLIFSLIVFMTTMGCHWKVRKQHHLLVNGARDQAPQQRRETLFNTLLLSIGAYFVSVAGQTFIEIAVFCVHNRDDVAEKAQWYQLARIAAFTDPLFNPLLVSVRTPALRRKIRCYVRYMSSLLALICCPWRRHLHLSVKRTKARTSSTTGTADSSNSHRTVATHSDELTLKFLCAQQVVRTSSMCGRSVTSQTHNSVV